MRFWLSVAVLLWVLSVGLVVSPWVLLDLVFFNGLLLVCAGTLALRPGRAIGAPGSIRRLR